MTSSRPSGTWTWSDAVRVKVSQGFGGPVRFEFDDQHAISIVLNERTSMDRVVRHRGTLHRKRIDDAVRIDELRRRPAEEPEPTDRIEVARIASPMPRSAIDLELGFAVADPVEIARQHVLTRDDHFSGVHRRQRIMIKSVARVRSNRLSPAVGKDS